jgi:phosphoacetylglucosamine mutase
MGRDNVLIAKTGVKHVHAAAHENFDVGIYFEANGHGTVLFHQERFGAFLRACPSRLRQCRAWQRLRLLPSLINPAVGDALSDLLLVDVILQIKGWDIATWNSKMYSDLPSRQLKVEVKDRKLDWWNCIQNVNDSLYRLIHVSLLFLVLA